MGFEASNLGMTPFGGRQYMWGNMPALDVLNLQRNEGFEEGRDYTLLFAGKTDTPNLVPTAELSLPLVISETW